MDCSPEEGDILFDDFEEASKYFKDVYVGEMKIKHEAEEKDAQRINDELENGKPIESLGDGTYIGQSLVLWNTKLPNVGGVVAWIVTLVKLSQRKKAASPMFVTPLGIVIEDRLKQPANEPSAMLMILLGISILIKPLQRLKAFLPVLVTQFPIIAEVIAEASYPLVSTSPWVKVLEPLQNTTFVSPPL